MLKRLTGALLFCALISQPVHAQQSIDGTPRPFKITPTADGKLRIEMIVDGESKASTAFSALEIDALIGVLSDEREKMADQVPRELPFKKANYVTTVDPAWRPFITSRNTRALAFRHPGLGWLFFEFPDKEALAIADWLQHPK
jgi:hypothetical protein